jgi:hypothetical protein
MASNRNILNVLTKFSTIPLLVVVAVFFYAIGGRSMFNAVTGDPATCKRTVQVNITELLINVQDAKDEEERCARTFSLEYRELCRQTMFGYQFSKLFRIMFSATSTFFVEVTRLPTRENTLIVLRQF